MSINPPPPSYNISPKPFAPGKNNYSAAMNSKFVLERNGGEEVKSEGKRAKRESERVINKRYWHVRNITDKLSDVNCNTIKDFLDSCTFSDMYHYYTCPDLGPRKAALRRLACNYEACDEQITMTWAMGLDAEDQK